MHTLFAYHSQKLDYYYSDATIKDVALSSEQSPQTPAYASTQ